MKSIEDKIFNRIKRHGRGWVFSAVDMADLASRESIDFAFFCLKKKSTIRNITQGLYDYPEISEMVQEPLPVDIQKAAEAFARKFGWDIMPSGETALNLLGISNQVPARYVYISTGRTVSYSIGNRELQFKKGKSKDSKVKLPQSKLLIQAIYALGKENLDDENIALLRSRVDKSKYTRILKDTKIVTGWVYDTIKRICIENQ